MSYLDYYNLFAIENKDNCSSCKVDKPKKTSSILPEISCANDKKNPVNLPDLTACQNLCLDNNNCKAWAYQKNNGKCYLINKTPLCNANKNYTSGEILEYDFDLNKSSKKLQSKTSYDKNTINKGIYVFK